MEKSKVLQFNVFQYIDKQMNIINMVNVVNLKTTQCVSFFQQKQNFLFWYRKFM